MFRTVSKPVARLGRAALILISVALISDPAAADFKQQGAALIGTDGVGHNAVGSSVAMSADGNTLIVSDPNDNSSAGAAFVYTRSNGVWSQQGAKLVGTGGVGNPQQGWSVALSGDGNTAALGARYDNSIGAVWIFTRSGGVWSQQGSKLIPNDYSAVPYFGTSVALSVDGNTLLAGGPQDAFGAGASWVFTRSNGVWTQQGAKIVGTGAANGRDGSSQGTAVALSGDGNTAVVGAPFDGRPNVARYGGTGAVWVFTRNAGVWSQQGPKLLASDVTDTGQYYYPEQGRSVAVSADGNTLMFGAPYDNYSAGGPGAAWIFTRSNGAWTQQGSKLVGTGSTLSSGCAEANCVLQGWSVALSGDATTAFVGGRTDGTGGSPTGAVWAFTHGSNGWVQSGSKLVGTGATGNAQVGYGVALSNSGTTGVAGSVGQGAFVFVQGCLRASHDFNNDCTSDIFWRNTGGSNVLWLMNGAAVSSVAALGGVDTSWMPVGQRDFDGDGKTDILWRNSGGSNAIWFMNGATVTSVALISGVATNWSVVGTADFNGDGKGDILWRNTDGTVAVWLMNGATVSSVAILGGIGTNWTVAGVADFDGDGKGDILWREAGGSNAIWFMNGAAIGSVSLIGGVATNWSVAGTADFNGDGKGDILWRNDSGSNAIWLMNGASVASVALIGGVGTSWTVASNGDYNGDGKGDILWREAGGTNAIWLMNGATVSSVSLIGGVANNWSVQNAGAN